MEVVNEIMYSIDGAKEGWTPEIKEISTRLQNSPKNTVIESIKMSSIKMVNITGDKQMPLRFNLLYNNGDIASDRVDFLMATQNGQLLKYGRNVSIINEPNEYVISSKYNPNEKRIANENKWINLMEATEDDDVKDEKNRICLNCTYTQSNIKYNMSVINKSNFNYSKHDYYKNYTFVLDSSNNEIFIESKAEESNDIQWESISNYQTNWKDMKMNNFFIVRNKDEDNKDDYIAFVTSNGEVIIYKISINAWGKISMTYKTVIHMTETVKMINVYKTSFIFAIDDKGLVSYDIDNPSQNSSIISHKQLNGNILDFVLINNLIYAIVKDQGWLIYNLSNNKTEYYYHKNMIKIDRYINPFQNNNYIGIFIEQQNDGEEFYMEWYINKTNNVNTTVINKLFYGAKHGFLPPVSPNMFFLHFYSKQDNTIYIIRKGIFNAVNFQSYKIKWPDDIKNINDISYLSGAGMEENSWVLSSETSSVIITDIIFPLHYWNCTFRESGFYSLRFLQSGDACNMSLKNGYPVCQKILYYSFNILHHDSGKYLSTVSAWLISLYVIFSMLLLWIIIRITHCFKVNKLRVNRVVDKENRIQWYNEGTIQEKEAMDIDKMQKIIENEKDYYIDDKDIGREWNNLRSGKSVKTEIHSKRSEFQTNERASQNKKYDKKRMSGSNLNNISNMSSNRHLECSQQSSKIMKDFSLTSDIKIYGKNYIDDEMSG